MWIFVILLALSVVYYLSFGFMAKRYEHKILQVACDSTQVDIASAESDTTTMKLYKKLLRDSSEATAYPVFGVSYKRLLEKRLNLGLDLQGGMSVTMEVDLPALLVALSGDNTNEVFRKSIADAKQARLSSTSSYISLFADAWKKNNTANVALWRIFDTYENKGKFPNKATDDDVIKILQQEADDAINNSEKIIKDRIDRFGVSQPTIQKQLLTGRIIVELPGVDDPDRVIGIIGTTANMEFWDTYRTDDVTGKILEIFSTIGKITAPDLYSQDPQRATKDSLMRAALQVPNLSEAAQDSIRKVYADTTITPDSLLSEKDLARKYPLRGKFQPIMQSGVALLGQALVGDTAEVNRIFNMPEARQLLPSDLKLAWASKAEGNVVGLYGLKAATGTILKPELDGEHIVDARQTFSEVGAVEVTMNMDVEGAGIWRKMTARNANDKNRPIAIVLDGRVLSAPSVQSEIPNGSSVITFGDPGRDNTKVLEEATDLAALLKAGSLPAPARIIDQVTVGPSLGEQNIQAGLWSFIIAFIVILIYMVFYYAWAGWAANVALVANLFFLIGALVSLGGSLTLPGIAGIVLTMGMAVDANVLIYERVKEELRLGKGMSAAMKDGFIKALSAILDGNATTLLTGIVLFVVGTGPIRGFATTLIIGIFTTLFTALLVSRLILYRRLDSKKPITFYSNITKNWFTKMNFDFVKKRYVYYTISATILIAGLVSALSRDEAFNVGVEFKGGTSAKISFAQPMDDESVRNALNSTLVDDKGQTSTLTVQRVNNDGKQFKITTGYLSGSEIEGVDLLVKEKIKSAFAGQEGFIIDSVNKVDPSMSDDFRKEAYWATIISLILVGVYIMIRFRKWDFAVGATIALFHDALIVIAAFTLLNGVVPFSLEINQNFIGAILTIVGYSINDTVVIFDRVREYFNTRRNAPLESTINDALNSTLGRSINTSMTVLLTLLVMFIFGSDDIRGFCFAMIIGVISGVYSTLFIATPIVVDMRKIFKGSSTSDAGEDKKAAVKTANV